MVCNDYCISRCLIGMFDIIIIPGRHDLTKPLKTCLANAIYQACTRGAQIVGLCYVTYALAYTGILDGKKASTHWMAEIDFKIPHLSDNTLKTDIKLVQTYGVELSLNNKIC